MPCTLGRRGMAPDTQNLLFVRLLHAQIVGECLLDWRRHVAR
jgi:hypothetical protein